MRKSTLVSLLILCGSTAALAQVAQPSEQRLNNTTNGNAMANEMAPDTTTDTRPPAGEPMIDPSTTDNTVMGNEANPKPM